MSNKNLTEIVFILDRSGSMAGLESDTIGGFNGMLEKQKNGEGDALVSMVFFDDEEEIIHDRKSLGEIKPLTSEEYYVRGCTALLDAIGDTIEHISKARKEVPKEERPSKTLFVITTDGMENASKKYSFADVKKKIEKKQKKGWEFLFLGANIDAIQVADSVGIPTLRAANYHNDSEGVARNFASIGDVMLRVRSFNPDSKGMGQMIDDDCLEAIREDFDRRKGDDGR